MTAAQLDVWFVRERETPGEYAFAVMSPDGRLGYQCTVSKSLARQKQPWDPQQWAEEKARQMAVHAFYAALNAMRRERTQ